MPLLYVLALRPYLSRLKENPVLSGITLPGATISVRYTAYVDDVSMLVTSTAGIHKFERMRWSQMP